MRGEVCPEVHIGICGKAADRADAIDYRFYDHVVIQAPKASYLDGVWTILDSVTSAEGNKTATECVHIKGDAALRCITDIRVRIIVQDDDGPQTIADFHCRLKKVALK